MKDATVNVEGRNFPLAVVGVFNELGSPQVRLDIKLLLGQLVFFQKPLGLAAVRAPARSVAADVHEVPSHHRDTEAQGKQKLEIRNWKLAALFSSF